MSLADFLSFRYSNSSSVMNIPLFPGSWALMVYDQSEAISRSTDAIYDHLAAIQAQI
jgi:hypothetical protein